MVNKKVEFVGLVSGHGTSLLPLTNYLKKEMYPILNKPFLEYTLENVRQLTDRVIIVLGPHSEQIQKYFGSEWKNLKIDYIHQVDPRGTADAVYKVFNKFGMETAIFWFGDTYIPKSLFVKFLESPRDNLMAYKKVDFIPKAPIEIDSFGCVTCVVDCHSGYAGTGLVKLNRSVIDYFKMFQKENRLRFIIRDAIDDGHKFFGVEADEWIHMGILEGGNIRDNPVEHRNCFKEIVDYFYEKEQK